MKSIANLRNQINKIPAGQPFAGSLLVKYASTANTRQVLCRLTKSGEITRVARGIFMRPKKATYVFKAMPSPKEVAEVIARTSGELIGLNGAEAALRLKLTTQVPMKPIFYTTGNTRHIKMGKLEITLKHVSPKKIINPGTTTEIVISALWYLGKKNVNKKVIEKIASQLTVEDFTAVLNSVNNMPAWMADAFYHYQKEKDNYAE